VILRLLAVLTLIYGVGFVVFGLLLGRPAADVFEKTDAAIVLTGGEGRLERGLAVLRAGGAKRLLIAGADPSVRKSDIARRVPGSGPLVRCCVDLGSESVDTRSNAAEAETWLDAHHFQSYRLITSDWHMRRSSFEFDRQMGKTRHRLPDAVRTEPRFRTLFTEYNKYLLRRIALAVGL
jgi:uncharacterized SAM-binding protein YcdF (DUF218 family)